MIFLTFFPFFLALVYNAKIATEFIDIKTALGGNNANCKNNTVYTRRSNISPKISTCEISSRGVRHFQYCLIILKRVWQIRCFLKKDKKADRHLEKEVSGFSLSDNKLAKQNTLIRRQNIPVFVSIKISFSKFGRDQFLTDFTLFSLANTPSFLVIKRAACIKDL